MICLPHYTPLPQLPSQQQQQHQQPLCCRTRNALFTPHYFIRILFIFAPPVDGTGQQGRHILMEIQIWPATRAIVAPFVPFSNVVFVPVGFPVEPSVENYVTESEQKGSNHAWEGASDAAVWGPS